LNTALAQAASTVPLASVDEEIPSSFDATDVVASATESAPSQGLGTPARVILFVLSAAGAGIAIWQQTEVKQQESQFADAARHFRATPGVREYQHMSDIKHSADKAIIYRNVAASAGAFCLIGGIFF
jgi:uncharacterized protein HemX